MALESFTGKGIGVKVVVIGADYKVTMQAEAALHTWSNRAGEPGEQIAEGPHRDDPDVKVEIQYIEAALTNADTRIIAKYGGVEAISDRLIELKDLPKSVGATGVSIDSYETWVSDRLRVLESDL